MLYYSQNMRHTNLIKHITHTVLKKKYHTEFYEINMNNAPWKAILIFWWFLMDVWAKHINMKLNKFTASDMQMPSTTNSYKLRPNYYSLVSYFMEISKMHDIGIDHIDRVGLWPTWHAFIIKINTSHECLYDFLCIGYCLKDIIRNAIVC